VLAWRTRSIWPGVAAHACINGVSTVLALSRLKHHRGAVSATVAIAVLFVVVGCSEPGTDVNPNPSHPQTLAGTAWRAISVTGAAPVQGREPTLVFADEQQVNGNTGCNGFSVAMPTATARSSSRTSA